MSQVYIVFFKLFICFGLGFALNKSHVLDMRGEKIMTEILLKAVLPFMIISSSQTPFSFDELRGLGAMFAFATAYYAVSLAVSRMCYKHTSASDDERRVMTTCTVFANTGFVGFPLMHALYGDRGLLLAAVFNLMYNAALMVKAGVGYAISIDGIVNTDSESDLCFRPLTPKMTSGLDLIWKKYQAFSPAAEMFLERLRGRFSGKGSDIV